MLKAIGSAQSFSKSDERRLAALFAAALGIVFIFGVGFAGSAAIHDAAHDTRHAFTFPCH